MPASAFNNDLASTFRVLFRPTGCAVWCAVCGFVLVACVRRMSDRMGIQNCGHAAKTRGVRFDDGDPWTSQILDWQDAPRSPLRSWRRNRRLARGFHIRLLCQHISGKHCVSFRSEACAAMFGRHFGRSCFALAIAGPPHMSNCRGSQWWRMGWGRKEGRVATKDGWRERGLSMSAWRVVCKRPIS